MKVLTARGREYDALQIDAYIALWREVNSPAELREWPNGVVVRIVSLPYCDRPYLACTCPRARYGRSGANGCPHAWAAVRWLVEGGACEGVKGGVALFAGGASGTCLHATVPGDVTGQLSPLVSPSVSAKVSPPSPQFVSTGAL
jgi:hypothetical protein